jgi:hypothetical protein
MIYRDTETSMSVTFELPSEIERQLRRVLENLDQAAKEATLVALYRQHKLSYWELSCALALSRPETEELLKRHNVTEDLPSEEEHLEALNRLRGT